MSVPVSFLLFYGKRAGRGGALSIERSKNMGKERMKLEKQTLYIRVPMELDHHSADAICRRADELVQAKDVREIVFDFSETEFCDSSGIGVIMGRYKKVCMFGGEVWAAHTSERIKKILKMSGAAKIMQIYEEEK